MMSDPWAAEKTTEDEFDIFSQKPKQQEAYVVSLPNYLDNLSDQHETLLKTALGEKENPLIMVIDDDPNIRDALSIALQDKYTIEICADGDEGIEKINAQCCAVVLDIKMKGKDGFDTFKAIRGKTPLLPIIFHSAYQDIKNPYVVMNHYRPFGYIQKEGNLKTLTDTVASAVSYYRQILANQILLAKIASLNNRLEKDVSKRTQEAMLARQDADKANQLKSTYLSNMSHEIRTPINAILGYTELLREDAEASKQIHFIPDLDKIYQSGDYLLGIINDILDLSKVEAGKMELYLQQYPLSPIIDSIIDNLQPTIYAQNNQLTVNFPNKKIEFKTDTVKLKQIILNIFTNACKFTKDGKITLTIQEYEKNNQAWLLIAISDTGIGLTETQINSIFQRFSQANVTTSNTYGGTGLGLAISQKLAHLLGGEITVESEMNVGTTFTTHLPLNYFKG